MSNGTTNGKKQILKRKPVNGGAHAKSNKRVGRPSSIHNPVTVKAILDAVRDGNYMKIACAAGGISEATFYDWVQRGEAGEQPFSEFLESVRRAEKEAELNLVKQWKKIIRKQKSNPEAIIKMLERRFRERWGRTDRHEITGVAGGDPIVMVVSNDYIPDLVKTVPGKEGKDE